MATNFYFQSGIPMGKRSESLLMEDLIIECLKIYGFDVYYIPRKEENEDLILNEDVLNTYTYAQPLEMYLENVDGFGGDGELLTKFGLEIRDTATFIVSRRRWENVIGQAGNTVLSNRPAEGDIIYFPLTKSFFEIKKVETKDPFFQVGQLYVYKIYCELMQYSSERFDTGVEEIDDITEQIGQEIQNFELLLEGPGYNNYKFLLEYETRSVVILEDYTITTVDKIADNEYFDTGIADILDFTERNPFGEVFNR
jgi:hypothetical protein